MFGLLCEVWISPTLLPMYLTSTHTPGPTPVRVTASGDRDVSIDGLPSLQTIQPAGF